MVDRLHSLDTFYLNQTANIHPCTRRIAAGECVRDIFRLERETAEPPTLPGRDQGLFVDVGFSPLRWNFSHPEKRAYSFRGGTREGHLQPGKAHRQTGEDQPRR